MIQDLGIRERAEEREARLSTFAAKSALSRGRLTSEPPCPMRTAFQRDRDRILYSKAFRRLKHKTQVFIAPIDDHYVTRLTHTLQVAQIARTLARALDLNEDLAEAISLGHDLGHTPFGHVGEEVLNDLCPGGFRHNEQSLRVVTLLEKNGQGLNLTWEVRDGIARHSKSRAEVLGEGWGETGTLEAEAVKLADVVAYVNHDTEDAIRAGVIREDEIPGIVTERLGTGQSGRIYTVVSDIITNSWAVTGRTVTTKPPAIAMSEFVREPVNVLRQFLFERVYHRAAQKEDSLKAKYVVEFLFRHFTANPGLLPEEYASRCDSIERTAADYVAGMTDLYALRMAQEYSR